MIYERPNTQYTVVYQNLSPGAANLARTGDLDTTIKGVRIITYSQIHSILTNKANFGNDKMNINTIVTMSYIILRHLKGWKNKANSNPIKPKTNPIQTQFKPKQTQFKPNFTTLKGANCLPLCSECFILWSLANIKFRIKGVVK